LDWTQRDPVCRTRRLIGHALQDASDNALPVDVTFVVIVAMIFAGLRCLRCDEGGPSALRLNLSNCEQGQNQDREHYRRFVSFPNHGRVSFDREVKQSREYGWPTRCARRARMVRSVVIAVKVMLDMQLFEN
jgi:hypothetical protein